MRIAVYHDLPSGGAKRVIYEVVRRLADRHQIDIYSLSTADESFCDVRAFTGAHRSFPFQPARLFNSPFGRLNQWQRMRNLRQLEAVGAQAAAAIDAEGYDAVWVHPCMWLQAPHVLAHLRTPSSFYVHESMRWAYEEEIARPGTERAGWRRAIDALDPLDQLYRRSAIRADWRNLNAATHLHANSEFTAANVLQNYGRAAHVCYPGVDAELFSPRANVSCEPWILSVGEIRPSKSFDFLIECLALIPKDRRVPLRLIGNASRGEEVAFLEDLARRREVDLQIETNVPIGALIERFHQAALVAYAPIREPLGLVPLEAMACGTPVVGVAEGGVRETVAHGQTGLLTPRDPRAFADALETLLRNRDLRDSLGREGRKRVLEQWTWDRTADGVESCLEELSRFAGSKAHARAEALPALSS